MDAGTDVERQYAEMNTHVVPSTLRILVSHLLYFLLVSVMVVVVVVAVVGRRRRSRFVVQSQSQS